MKNFGWRIKENFPDFQISVLFCDGGSIDNTKNIISNDFPVILSKKGRGIQFWNGVKILKGDLIILLHSDMQLKKNALKDLAVYFENRNSALWGVLGHRYDEKSLRMKLIAFLNYIRIKFTKIAFGDQGIFFLRECIKTIEGIEDIPVMEDVELSLQLIKFRGPAILKDEMTVSSRRWKKSGFYNNFVKVIFNFLKYIILRSMGINKYKLSEKIYFDYYGEHL